MDTKKGPNHTSDQGGVHVRKAKAVYKGIQVGGSADTDRGSQYVATDYRELLTTHQLVPSMSRRGNCYDNAVAESFFATLKWELLERQQWSTRAAARTAIFEYIEIWYNRQRRHSTLGYQSPWQFEQGLRLAA